MEQSNTSDTENDLVLPSEQKFLKVYNSLYHPEQQSQHVPKVTTSEGYEYLTEVSVDELYQEEKRDENCKDCPTRCFGISKRYLIIGGVLFVFGLLFMFIGLVKGLVFGHMEHGGIVFFIGTGLACLGLVLGLILCIINHQRRRTIFKMREREKQAQFEYVTREVTQEMKRTESEKDNDDDDFVNPVSMTIELGDL